MKNISTILTLLIISAAASMAQTSGTLEVMIAEDGPYLELCPGQSHSFAASATYDGEPIAADLYIWDFDNGNILETDTDMIEYSYREGGAYMMRVTARLGEESATSLLPVRVGMPPSYSQYSNDIPKNYSGICLGESFSLRLPVSARPVSYTHRTSMMESSPQSIYAGQWAGEITLNGFGDEIINSPGYIDGFAVYMDCTEESDLMLELTSPQGNTIILKDFGEAMPTASNYTYRKYETRKYIFDTQNTDMQALTGSPLNGSWTLKASLRGLDAEGSVLGFEILIPKQIADAHSWTYTQEYDLRRAVWSGKGVSATSSGEAKTTPPQEGNNRYSFIISDNQGCMHDTTVYISVERATFTGADSTSFIGDEINFECKASWASETSWGFGDKTPTAQGSPAPHAYYEKGKYIVVMQAKSAKGCIDIDTQVVSIVPRPLEVKEVNIFTPNGDGQNDVFTFFLEDESFLKSGGLTKMPANIRSIKGKIYNVYGQTVYKWDEVEASIFGWDGTWNNKGSRDCPPGTYYYDIIVYGKDGNSLKRTGSILLYRSK